MSDEPPKKASVSKLSFDTDAYSLVLFCQNRIAICDFCSAENQVLIIERTLTKLRVDVSRPLLLEANRDGLPF